jgi:two-component system sensor histidine kinase/response regulator
MTNVSNTKILLVDDVDENLWALEALLRRDGLELLLARSGREALELLLVHDVALALLDVQMPEMDGFELAELMRGTERTRHVPIIFLTAVHDTQRVFRGYEVGAVDFLFKPLDPALLAHKVSTFVELHRQRIQLERLADELREMLHLNEMFVAAVSHDLRSPLSTVMMGAALLDNAVTDPTAKRAVARISSGASRMAGMLDQLYDLASARLAGGLALDLREADIRVLADKVFEELRLAYPDRSLIVQYDHGSIVGLWDEQRLGQVFTNLVGNAFRHGARGEDVRVVVGGASPVLVVEVHNGGEIPAELRPHLFDPFRRGSHAARDSLGLGLYIVRQIVLAHGGTIEFSSSAEAGTTFRMTLPRRTELRLESVTAQKTDQLLVVDATLPTSAEETRSVG